MKRIFVIALAALVCFHPCSAKAQKGSTLERIIDSGKIRCGYLVWPPFIVKDPNTGEMSGINYDYMTEIGEILGLEIEWTEEVAAGNAIASLRAGRFDVMCATLWSDEGRLKHSLMSDPAFYDSVKVVVRKDDDRFDNGKKPVNSPDVTIAGIEGDATAAVAFAKFPEAKQYTLPQIADGGQLLQSVVAGKADVVIVDKGTVVDFNRTNGDLLKVVEGLPTVYVLPESLAVERGETELRMMLDSAIRIITDRGVAEELVRQYPEYEYYAPAKSW